MICVDQLWYYIDTAKASVVSKRVNTYTHLFSVFFEILRSIYIINKLCEDKAFSLLFETDVTCSAMIMNGSKDQILGKMNTNVEKRDDMSNVYNYNLLYAAYVRLQSKRLIWHQAGTYTRVITQMN